MDSPGLAEITNENGGGFRRRAAPTNVASPILPGDGGDRGMVAPGPSGIDVAMAVGAASWVIAELPRVPLRLVARM